MMCVRYIIVHGGPCHLQTFSTCAAPGLTAPRLVAPRLASPLCLAAPLRASPLCLAAFHVATPKRPLTLSSSASKRICNAEDMTFIHSWLKIMGLGKSEKCMQYYSKEWEQIKQRSIHYCKLPWQLIQESNYFDSLYFCNLKEVASRRLNSIIITVAINFSAYCIRASWCTASWFIT